MYKSALEDRWLADWRSVSRSELLLERRHAAKVLAFVERVFEGAAPARENRGRKEEENKHGRIIAWNIQRCQSPTT